MVKELELKLKREHSQCLQFTKVIFDFDLLSELEKWTYQNIIICSLYNLMICIDCI